MSIHSEPRFAWDPEKAAANLRAHGVAFPEAASVLEDERSLTREDPDAIVEARFVTLGMSSLGGSSLSSGRSPRQTKSD